MKEPNDLLKTKRVGWCLFDFAGEMLMTNGGLYFLPWLAVDIGTSDNWYNVALIVTSVALIITGPLLGRMQDRKQNQYLYLWLTSFFMFLATIGIHVVDVRVHFSLLKGALALGCFSILLYCYQLGLISYNAMLRALSSPQSYSRTSSLGSAAGWAGAIVGILAVLPFVDGNIHWLRSGGRAAAFLPSALFYGAAVCLSLWLMRGHNRAKTFHNDDSFTQPCATDPTEVHRSNGKRDIVLFLLALFLFMDAVLTIENNASFYLVTVMKYSENAKALLFLLLLAMAVLGALLPAYLGKTISQKRLLIGILWGWVVTILAISLTRNQVVFAALFAVIGLLYGALGNVARVVFLLLTPSNRTTQHFGIYASFQRFATLVGPALWIVTAWALRGLGAERYRFSMAAMAVLICVSLVFLANVSEPTVVPTSKQNSDNQLKTDPA